MLIEGFVLLAKINEGSTAAKQFWEPEIFCPITDLTVYTVPLKLFVPQYKIPSEVNRDVMQTFSLLFVAEPGKYCTHSLGESLA